MYVVTNEEMRAIDQRAIQQWEIPSTVLMESAGLAVVTRLEQDFPDLSAQRVTILAGNGNNGGDGLVIARHLYMRNHAVTVLVFNEDGNCSEDHFINRRILNHMPIRVFDIAKSQQLKILKATLNHTDIVLDCLFGTGLNRAVSPLYIDVFQMVNDQKNIQRIAVDCPSGLNGNTGQVKSEAIRAHKTYTLAWPKVGFYQPGAEIFTGALHVLPIGIPHEVADMEKPQVQLLQAHLLKDYLTQQPSDAHKGMFGHVGIIAGSIGMSGACVLAAKSALRTGAGVVTALVDKAIFNPVATMLPEAMVRPVTWPNGQVLNWLMERTDTLVVGPGMGMTEEKKQIVHDILASHTGTLILDADALSLLASEGLDQLRETKAQVILTPHPGEMGRMVGTTSADIQTDRLAHARHLAETCQCTVVLKGHHTVIAAATGQVRINACDSVALATAGSGDVLAGCIAAFAAQGLSPFTAACAGVLLHGMAGQFCARTYGTRGTTAGLILEGIGATLQESEQSY